MIRVAAKVRRRRVDCSIERAYGDPVVKMSRRIRPYRSAIDAMENWRIAYGVRNGQLAREGGKPHHVDWLYRPEGTDETFVRGAVTHPDHETIRLQVWHRVVQNNEVPRTSVSEAFTRLMYFD